MDVIPLHPRFGVRVKGVDLRTVTAGASYAALRALFEEHSLLWFSGQDLDDDGHLTLGTLFGTIEIREKVTAGLRPTISSVSNVRADATLVPETDHHLMHLKANQLWHTDSTFLPVPALANILAARVLPSRGGETEFASTRAAFADMPAALKARARKAVLRHRYAHSRAKISAELAKGDLFTMWTDQLWRAVWRNPVNGRDAVYIASHACAVEGLDEAEGRALIDELTAWCTRPAYVYCHTWAPGDVLIWDERATLHRGRPWPYDQARTLASICVSVGPKDGLESIRPAA
jgi:alpha-ketoglutarate-dependent 2,4-dichlorophenoxyacetate dioxygenase